MESIYTGLFGINSIVTWSGETLENISALTDFNFKIKLNGIEKQLKNEDGIPLSPIIYNDRSYLPLRARSKLLNMGIHGEDSTRTVNIHQDIKDRRDFFGGEYAKYFVRNEYGRILDRQNIRT